jgi:hypothetical protein
MNIDHYIGVYDNVITEEQCQEIIDKFEAINASSWRNNFEVQDGGDQFANSDLGRKDTSLFFQIVAKPHGKFIHEAVGKCMEDYTSHYIGLKGTPLISYCVKVQKTAPRGGYHVWHAEHAGDEGSMRRAVVWALYLTTHENEGETEFLQQGIRVAPQAGRVVIWPASYTHPHRGNPVYDADKYIATGWFEHYYDVK